MAACGEFLMAVDITSTPFEKRMAMRPCPTLGLPHLLLTRPGPFPSPLPLLFSPPSSPPLPLFPFLSSPSPPLSPSRALLDRQRNRLTSPSPLNITFVLYFRLFSPALTTNFTNSLDAPSPLLLDTYPCLTLSIFSHSNLPSNVSLSSPL